jgi:predicted O-linked N-acetylglucosamine transferase (SPINDLY family)
MGLPLLTCIGEAFASRVAASLLKALDLPELIASNTTAYETMAIDLARQPDKLKRIRQQLKANLNNANLFNTPLFSKHIESAYQQMYQNQRRGEAMRSIFVSD